MVVDEVLWQSMAQPWITIVFDIATRVVLGFDLRLDPPSAISVGLALTMACLPKVRWLEERRLDVEWARAGLPRLNHVDNAKEFHGLASMRGCERRGLSWRAHRALPRHADAPIPRTTGDDLLEPD